MCSADERYADAIHLILREGEPKADRTGTSTLSYTGLQLRLDLRQGFPLLTRKRVPFRVLAVELQWFLQGRTDVQWLQDRNVHIWDDDAGKAQARGFTDYPEGELGPVYGAQWRTWGGRGLDQLQKLRKDLANNRCSRRMIVSAWNAEDVPKMVLPPCHFAWQVLVSDDNMLDLVLSQRSGDMGLGVPFNMASYALLMTLLAREHGLTPRHLILNIGDAHIYRNHVDQLRDDFLTRPTHPSCTLQLPDAIQTVDDFARCEPSDQWLVGYQHSGALRLPLST